MKGYRNTTRTTIVNTLINNCDYGTAAENALASPAVGRYLYLALALFFAKAVLFLCLLYAGSRTAKRSEFDESLANA